MHTSIRFPLALILVLLFSSQIFGQSNKIKIDSYEISASIHDVSDSLINVNVTCIALKIDNASSVTMLLNSEIMNPKIRFSRNGYKYDTQFEFKGKDTLQLHFPEKVRDSGAVIMNFSYEIAITPLKNSMLLIDRGHRWYPLISDQISGVKLRAHVPKGFAVLGTGNLVNHDREPWINAVDIYEWTSEWPVFKIPLIVYKESDYRIDSITNSGTPIVLISKNDNAKFRESMLIEAEHMFSFCNDNIGKYPYEKLYLFEVPDFEGINIGSGLLQIGTAYFDAFEKGYYDGLHLTVTQQWFGASAFAKFGERGFWFLSLSLPHYIRLMNLRQFRGEIAFQEEMKQLLEKYKEIAGKENDVPVLDIDFPNTKEKGTVLYTKGPYIFSRINEMMGYEKFIEFLSGLYGTFKHRTMNYDEFALYVSKFDADGKIANYLKSALNEKGLPD